MRTYAIHIKGILSISILLSALVLSGCNGDSSPSATEIITKQLSANKWKISTVLIDDVVQTSLFTNMMLSFTDTNYTTTNGGPVWPTTGTWTFVDNTGKKIKRNDNLEITIIEISDTALKISLTWSKNIFGSGRISSVAGNHVFTFVK